MCSKNIFRKVNFWCGLFLVFSLLFSYFVFAENGIENELEESKYLVLSEYHFDVYVGDTYTKLFKIKIENKSPCSPKDEVQMFYNITKLETGEVVNNNFTKEVGCSSSASTGTFSPLESGAYQICGTVISLSFNESDLEDNVVCYNVSVIDSSLTECDFGIDLEIKEGKFHLYQEGESMKYQPEVVEKEGQDFPFQIEYWIEDLFGEIVKSKRNTTNTNQKTWKTKLVNNERERIFNVKMNLVPSCADTNLSDNFVEKMFLVMEGVIVETNVSNETNETNEMGDGEVNGDVITEAGSSLINITKVHDTNISFGDLISFDVEIYKNNTGKYSISTWVEREEDGKVKTLSEKTKFHLKTKEQEYKLMLPVQLKSSCSYNLGTAKLVVEGLGVLEEQEIVISALEKGLCGDDMGTSGTNSGSSGTTSTIVTNNKLSYRVVDFPTSIFAGDLVSVKVELQGDQNEHDFKVWAYLYRGSKCYSCLDGEKERDANMQEFSLGVEEKKELVFELFADEGMDAKDYKLKVKLNKDGLKTDYELMEEFFVMESVTEQENICQCESEQSMNSLSTKSDVYNLPVGVSLDQQQQIVSKQEGLVSVMPDSKLIVYESSSEKAYQLIPYLLIITFGLLSVVLALKKKETI